MPTLKPALIASLLALAAGVAFAAPAPAPAQDPAWGKPVNGLRLGLYKAKSEGGGVRMMAVIENVGGDDLVLNLGMMLANGKKQLPTAVRLSLTGGDGKTRTLGRKFDGVAGRVDPFVVPLPAGCRYCVCCDLGQFEGSDAPGEPPAPGRYRVAAAFVGKAVTGDVNGDSGPGLMAYWSGTVRSADVQVPVPATPVK